MDLPSPSLPPTLFCIDDSPQALGPRNSDRGNAAWPYQGTISPSAVSSCFRAYSAMLERSPVVGGMNA
jgi:hypothetical protein